MANLQRAGVEGLSRVITRKSAEKILAHLSGRLTEGDAGAIRGAGGRGPKVRRQKLRSNADVLLG